MKFTGQPLYDPDRVRPMREELASQGFEELRTPEEVENRIASLQGTSLVMLNSVCGCAAGSARPGVLASLRHSSRPENLLTIFASLDKEATARFRSYFPEFPPSSPSVFLLKDKQAVFLLPRSEIEGCSPEEVSTKLQQAFEQSL